ncbi:hypothetical protein O5623_17655 [Escherichia coli]|nr:hypothetical protein [Escherichia coli]
MASTDGLCSPDGAGVAAGSTPAAESLNARWRTAVVDGWNNAFSGRYPFKMSAAMLRFPAGKIPEYGHGTYCPFSAE